MRSYRKSSFFGLLWLWCTHESGVLSQVFVTVDDTDPSIVYSPSASWSPNTPACTICPVVTGMTPFNNTFTDGTHTALDTDAGNEEKPKSPTTTSPAPTQSSAPSGTSPAAPASASDSDASGVPDNDNDPDDHSQGKGGGKSGRSIFPRLDVDDPGFVDTPVTVQLEFNGTAVWLFAVQDNSPTINASIPTNMNLSFTLDNQAYAPFFHNGTSSGFENATVFHADGLSQTMHTLLVSVGRNSVFLFDYMVYMQNITTPPDPSESQTSSSLNTTPATKKRHTFAGVLAGVAVAAFFAAVVVFFCIRRRSQKALFRERRDVIMQRMGGSSNNSQHSFIPRYFPGTVLPPSYSAVSQTATAATTVNESLDNKDGPLPPNIVNPTLLPQYSERRNTVSSGDGDSTTESDLSPTTRTTLSYADFAPSSTPPRTEDSHSLISIETSNSDPPPSFGEALAAPALSIIRGAFTPLLPTPANRLSTVSDPESLQSTRAQLGSSS